MKKILAILTLSIATLFWGCGYVLEESAVPVVNDILKEQLGDQAAQCVKVEISEKVTDKLYKANAILTNGNSIEITILDQGEQILVTVLEI